MKSMAGRVAAILTIIGSFVTALLHAHAQDDSRPKITAMRVGFGGSFKVGYWTPVGVTIRGGDEEFVARITVTVPDGDGVPSLVTMPDDRPIQIRPKQDTDVLLYAKIGQIDADVTVRLLRERRVAAERTFHSTVDPELGGALTADNELIVTVGPPIAIQVQAADSETAQTKRTQVVRLSDATQLPMRWQGYEGVDALIITTSDPNVYRQLSSNSARIEALDRWIERGGKLLLSVGKEANELSAADSPLAKFLPGKVQAPVNLRQAGGLETYADTTQRIDATAVAAGDRFQLQVPKFTDVHGKIEAFEGNDPAELPLVIRTAHGFGEIVVAAFDLDRPPISTWTAREALTNRLLRRPAPEAVAEITGGRATTLGYGDLAGQLRSGLDQFQGVQLVPFALVAMLIVGYILVIGPLDYWFVKRVLKRMELTWVTFPLAVLAFSAAAYFLAAWLKGDQLRVNQVDLIDVDANRKLVRGTMWANVFSPQHDAFELTLEKRLPEGFLRGTGGSEAIESSETLLSWMGLPGDSLGGMSGGGGASAAFSEPYRFSSSLDRLVGVPIAVWSTKAFTSRWTAHADSPVTLNVQSRPDGILLGSVTNEMESPLTECHLLYGQYSWPLGTISADGSIELTGREDPQKLESYLKPAAEGDLRRTYDPNTLDIDEILKAMAWHEASGGEIYTQLSSRYQGFVDLSHQLLIGRAVLVAKGPGRTQLMNGAEPLKSEQDRHWNLYRIIADVPISTGE